MLKIEFSNLQFHGFHGVYEEESKTGGSFEVNMIVYFKPESNYVKHLNETIDYSQLYDIIKLRMQQPTKLLETLAMEIAEIIMHKFLRVEEVIINIKKLKPPIPFFNGNVSVEYNLKRNN